MEVEPQVTDASTSQATTTTTSTNNQNPQSEFPQFFKRQIAIPDWNQPKIESTTALVLGAGGLGSCVSIQLMRLGLKKLILVDYDKVDDHNMNRQIMFSIEDIGKSKVESAKKNLEFHNIRKTEIEAVEIDAVKQWGKVVELARQSDLVFNLIDYGDYFDLAVSSLCLQLKLPMFQGGTFCNSLSVDYFTAEGRPCLLCLTDGLKQDIVQQLVPTRITEYTNLEFIPKNNNPEGQSNIVICQMCANFINSFVLNELFPSAPKKSKRVLLYLDPIDIISFDLERMHKCTYCREPYHAYPSEHTEESGVIQKSHDELWNLVKTLSLDKLFPSWIKSVKPVENSQIGMVDSQFEVEYKDGSKWTVKLVEVSALRSAIVYDLMQSMPQAACAKIRNTLSVASTGIDKHTSKLTWKTEFLDDISINAFEDTKYKKQDFLQALVVLTTNQKLTPEEPPLASVVAAATATATATTTVMA